MREVFLPHCHVIEVFLPHCNFLREVFLPHFVVGCVCLHVIFLQKFSRRLQTTCIVIALTAKKIFMFVTTFCPGTCTCTA